MTTVMAIVYIAVGSGIVIGALIVKLSEMMEDDR